MIKITVIRLANGMLVGQAFSDRWNLMSLRHLGRERGLKLDINACENKGQVDRLRRTLKGMGFALIVRSKGEIDLQLSESESLAMSTGLVPSRHLGKRHLAA